MYSFTAGLLGAARPARLGVWPRMAALADAVRLMAPPQEQLLPKVLDRLEKLPLDSRAAALPAEAELRACAAEVECLREAAAAAVEAVAAPQAHAEQGKTKEVRASNAVDWGADAATQREAWRRALLRLSAATLPTPAGGRSSSGDDGGGSAPLPTPRQALLPAIELLGSVTAVAFQLESAAWHRPQAGAARAAVVRSVCTSLAYVDGTWPWSGGDVAAAASANLAYIAGRLDASGLLTPPPAQGAAGGSGQAAAAVAAVFSLLGEVLRQMHSLAGSEIGDAIAAWVVERVDAYP
eukprot:COSAG01_NODE_2705_length_7221_cov_80.513760_4_plen_295_part_00